MFLTFFFLTLRKKVHFKTGKEEKKDEKRSNKKKLCSSCGAESSPQEQTSARAVQRFVPALGFAWGRTVEVLRLSVGCKAIGLSKEYGVSFKLGLKSFSFAADRTVLLGREYYMSCTECLRS